MSQAKIKVTEIFYSLQGEGRFTGVPSVFFRTFGCNFTCSGFGMPMGERSEERKLVDPADYVDLSKMPLVNTGCDSYASWDPRFRHLAKEYTAEEAAKEIVSLLPNGKFVAEHLVITGGEPLLAYGPPFYKELLSRPEFYSLKGLTFETNGSQTFPYPFEEFLTKWRDRHGSGSLTFSVSPKLPCSGEKWEIAINPHVVRKYQKIGDAYLKFVVATDDDLLDVERAVEEYQYEGFDGDIYLMPVGGVTGIYNLNKRKVAEMAMQKGYRYSDRLQCSLWDNEWGT